MANRVCALTFWTSVRHFQRVVISRPGSASPSNREVEGALITLSVLGCIVLDSGMRSAAVVVCSIAI